MELYSVERICLEYQCTIWRPNHKYRVCLYSLDLNYDIQKCLYSMEKFYIHDERRRLNGDMKLLMRSQERVRNIRSHKNFTTRILLL